ncbi:hypothetical protein NIES4073_64220 [Kalymmatonema gypsitolerans NIES-4073]|nr:hypothetical protein NIES4073_64220 [Scytonema sp. NIES-4073]
MVVHNWDILIVKAYVGILLLCLQKMTSFTLKINIKNDIIYFKDGERIFSSKLRLKFLYSKRFSYLFKLKKK